MKIKLKSKVKKATTIHHGQYTTEFSLHFNRSRIWKDEGLSKLIWSI